ncbi:MAG: phosphate ABC transporter ATP-binding protein [Balneola sp.]
MKNNSTLSIIHPSTSGIADTILHTSKLNVWINDSHILNDINLSIPKNEILCIIGPSGSGKSTLIRSFNRINDDVEGFNLQGTIQFKDGNIYDITQDTALLRSKIGMVFQKPCVFPVSIAENVLFGVQRQKKLSKIEKLNIVEENLKSVSLWKEVSHRLNDSATSLSIGQQQRLCIARTLAVKPEIIMMDEPTSSLDPVSARAIEDTILHLKKEYTIIFVTHNIQQAERVADQLVFLCDGKIIEQGPVNKLFKNPVNPQTKEYLKNEFCDC